MTTVEARVVDAVPNNGSVDTVDVSDVEMVEAAFKHQGNEKILEDEEIDSCEGVDLEEQMMNQAIANSVVDSGAQATKVEETQQSARYGLRKRPRPGDISEEANGGEVDSKAPATLAAAGAPRATITNGRLSLVAATPAASSDTGGKHSVPPGSEAPVPQLKLEPAQRSTPATSPLPLAPSGGTTKGKSRQRPAEQPIAPNIPLHSSPPLRPLVHPEASQPTAAPNVNAAPRMQSKPGTSVRVKKPSPAKRTVKQTSKTKGAKANASALRAAPMSALAPTSGAVPNPLSQSTPPHSSRAISSAMRSAPKVSTTSSVPCPLPPAVPCPLPSQPAAEVQQDKRVTIADPPVPTTRNRVFSVDLDPSTFDFMSSDHNDMSKNDDDIEDITGATPPPDDLAIFKRDRAFSFEFFTFAGDDLLPTPSGAPGNMSSGASLPEPDESVTSRPRGDSLIFDPVSFQDGGIHEKNAIIKVNAAKKMDAPAPTLLADSRLAATPSVQARTQPPPRPPAVAPHPGAPASHHALDPQSASDTDNSQVATLPSALTVPDANGNIAGTFQMELLNKDGRIGIYLPEARKARIARFHAKRKMRIWRKRIKYDCRKKLADSRPRIKGRFVKRSDMDE